MSCQTCKSDSNINMLASNTNTCWDRKNKELNGENPDSLRTWYESRLYYMERLDLILSYPAWLWFVIFIKEGFLVSLATKRNFNVLSEKGNWKKKRQIFEYLAQFDPLELTAQLFQQCALEMIWPSASEKKKFKRFILNVLSFLNS